MTKKKKIQPETRTKIVTVALFITYLNLFLEANNLQPIPVLSDDNIAIALAGISSIFAWFYNNYVTWKGRQQLTALKYKDLE